MERLEATPCRVIDGRIRPSAPDPSLPDEWAWLFTDGWWAQVDDATEILRYARLFGSMRVGD